MRHRKEKRPLGRTSAHREALMRNLVTSLIDAGRITTTLEKAKELRRVADRMVTLGKSGTLPARRLAARTVRTDAAVKKLFAELAPLSGSRPGGYTRILHLGNRPGDNARMAIIEFVDRPKPVVDETAKAAKTGKAKPKAEAKAPKAPVARKKAEPKGEAKARAQKPAPTTKKTTSVKKIGGAS